MRALITGATGFLGRNLIAHLRESRPAIELFAVGRNPVSLPGVNYSACDLTDPAAAQKIVSQVQPDWVFHLAGHSRVTDDAGVPEYFNHNFLTTANLIQGLDPIAKEVRLFFSSSVHVYGHQKETANESSAPHPISPYGFTKLLAEEALRDLAARRADRKVVVGRLYNCIGPGQPLGFVASDWCHQLRGLTGEGGAMSVGSLSGIRYFLDVRDAVQTFPRLLEKAGETFSLFNVASQSPTEIKDILEKLIAISGKRPKIESSRQAAPNRFAGLKISTQKLEKALPDLRFRPLEITLRDMYQA